MPHAPGDAGVVVPPEALLRPHKRVAAEYKEVLEGLVAFMGALLQPDGGPRVMVYRHEATVCGKLAVFLRRAG